MNIENAYEQEDLTMTEAGEVAEAAQRLADDAAPVLLEVRRGNPTPDELAALVAVVTAAAGNGGGQQDSNGALENWGDRFEALDRRGYYSFAPRSYANGSLGRY